MLLTRTINAKAKIHRRGLGYSWWNLIPKEKSPQSLREISVIFLVHEGKIFVCECVCVCVCVLAKRMTNFILSNNYVDIFVQKARIPGFSGCIEHKAVEQHKNDKLNKSAEFQVIWFDFVNAYVSVRHALRKKAMRFFYAPEDTRNPVSKYYVFQYGIFNWRAKIDTGIMMGLIIFFFTFCITNGNNITYRRG